jgi:hypothetical protein
MSLIVKLKFENDTRRITVNPDFTFDSLVELATKLFQTTEKLSFKYQDEDSDFITISSDLELAEAIKVHQQLGKRGLFLHVFKDTAPSNPPPASPAPNTINRVPEENMPWTSAFSQTGIQEFIQTLFRQGQVNFQELGAFFQSLNLSPEKLNSQNLQNTLDEVMKSFTNFQLSSQPPTPSQPQRRPSNGKEEVKESNGKEEVKEEAKESSVKPIHRGILCDGCGKTPIEGKRFKCTVCPDYDLCDACKIKPNIHPGHGFSEIAAPKVVHYHVTCDGCRKTPIEGIRYKCNVCSDYDLCEACKAKPNIHPGHAFSEISVPKALHFRVTCDGCNMHPIQGKRFKCDVCSNYDLCESCKARSGIHDPSHTFSEMTPRYCPRFRRGWQRSSQSNLMARYVCDVTMADGSTIPVGSSFTKVWRMRNEGEVAWPEKTHLSFVCGDRLSASSPVLPTIQPGSEVDISVDMVAPQAPGKYVAYFRLITPEGQRFGQKIWIDVNVVEKPEEPKKPAPEEAKKEEPQLKLPEVQVLLDMGFTDEQLLLQVLKQVNFDISRALEVLLQ